MKFSVIFFIPLLIAGSAALADSAPSDTGVAQFNHRQGVRAASFYAPRGVHRRSRETRRAATKETKRQSTATPDQIRAAILSLPEVKELSPVIQQFLTTVPSEIWAALPRLTPDQFTEALKLLEKGQLPNIASIPATAPVATPSAQP
ncbi:hypothetical protein TWF718_000133 [Orbilia javanica]|uniref:Uncharacterized protein n=1 Tax=Orbilia javanica TaxID=47235 RepID=A0AAN8N7K4_9PEZI